MKTVTHARQTSCTTLSQLIVGLFAQFEQDELPYCVLHNYQQLPHEVGNDLDILVDPAGLDRAYEATLTVAQQQGWSVVRTVCRRGIRTVYLATGTSGATDILHIDLLCELTVKRVAWANARYVLQHRRALRHFHVPQPGCEAVVALRGLLLSGTVRAKYREDMARYVWEDPDHMRGCLHGYFSTSLIETVIEYIRARDWAALAALAGPLKRSLWLHTMFRRMPSQVGRFAEYLYERAKEWFRPTGLFVALIGPDGCGKTTVANALAQRLDNTLFAGVVHYHRYPGYLPSLSRLWHGIRTPNSDRHHGNDYRHASRNPQLGLARALLNVVYYSLEFLILHLPLRRATGKGKLVCFDRYYYDYFIQNSYQRIPRWLLQGILRCIPRPDVVIYLHNTPESIHRRKAELSLFEIAQQSRVCERLIDGLPMGIRADTSRPLHEMLNGIIVRLLQSMVQREQSRHKGTADASVPGTSTGPGSARQTCPRVDSSRRALRVTHVTANLSDIAGGVGTAIWSLAQQQQDEGVRPHVAGVTDAFEMAPSDHKGAVSFHTTQVRGPSPVKFAPGLLEHLQVRQSDIIHAHGLWQYPGWAAGRIARKQGIPLIVSPHGMLEPWALHNSTLKKKLAGWLFETKNLRTAACLHATAEQEAENFRALGLMNPIAVIPIGLDVSQYAIEAERTILDTQWPSLQDKRLLLFMSRIHPKKGLLNLTQAWSELAEQFPDWHLVIAGPDENGHEQQVRNRIKAGGVEQRTTFTGPVYGRIKREFLAAGDLFVLPSFSENFGIVVPEALASRTPVVTTVTTPWSVLRNHRCGYTVEVGTKPLVAALQQAMSLSDHDRQAMGRRGRHLVQERFSWPHVTRQMTAVYDWLLGHRECPDCVRLN